jgi:hypothetical protein
MAWGDNYMPREAPNLDLPPHWSAALLEISLHCGLVKDHIEKEYAKILRHRNDQRKEEGIFRVPGCNLVVSNGTRAAQSIDIHHEPGKLFKIKMVLIDYGGEEVYVVGNTSARHFYDEGCGPDTTSNGVRSVVVSFLNPLSFRRCFCLDSFWQPASRGERSIMLKRGRGKSEREKKEEEKETGWWGRR